MGLDSASYTKGALFCMVEVSWLLDCLGLWSAWPEDQLACCLGFQSELPRQPPQPGQLGLSLLQSPAGDQAAEPGEVVVH